VFFRVKKKWVAQRRKKVQNNCSTMNREKNLKMMATGGRETESRREKIRQLWERG